MPHDVAFHYIFRPCKRIINEEKTRHKRRKTYGKYHLHIYGITLQKVCFNKKKCISLFGKFMEVRSRVSVCELGDLENPFISAERFPSSGVFRS